jgi:hypothetical protein
LRVLQTPVQVAQVKPLPDVQPLPPPEDSFMEAANMDKSFSGDFVPHSGQLSSLPSAPTFCSASKRVSHFLQRYS